MTYDEQTARESILRLRAQFYPQTMPKPVNIISSSLPKPCEYSLKSRRPTVRKWRERIEFYGGQRLQRPYTPEELISMFMRLTGTTPKNLYDHNAIIKRYWPRSICWWIVRRYALVPWHAMSAIFKRDHSTIIAGCRNITAIADDIDIETMAAEDAVIKLLFRGPFHPGRVSWQKTRSRISRPCEKNGRSGEVATKIES